jgi:hypothetical protein
MGQAKSKEEELSPEEQAKKQRKRREVLNEIVQTEETYVSCLEVIVTVFLEPLEEAIAQHKPILGEQEVAAIFANVKQLHQIHLAFLQDLQGFDVDKDIYFARIFLKHIPLLKIYTEYVNNYNISLSTLWKCRKRRSFEQFLQEVHRNPILKQRDLPTFLINPIQRLPRYVLLLQELERATGSQHRDYAELCRALTEVRELADYINREKRNAEIYQQLLQIQDSLGNSVNLLSSHRELLQEGDFSYRRMGETGGFLPMHFFLFNDLFMLALPRSALGRVSNLFSGQQRCWAVEAYSQLQHVEVRDASDTKDDAFLVDILLEGKGYTIKFPSSEEKSHSISLFYTARSKAHRVPYIDIAKKRKISDAPQTNNSEKDKGKGKEKENDKGRGKEREGKENEKEKSKVKSQDSKARDKQKETEKEKAKAKAKAKEKEKAKAKKAKDSKSKKTGKSMFDMLKDKDTALQKQALLSKFKPKEKKKKFCCC